MNSDDYRRLVAAALTPDQIAVVMEMMDRDARLHAEAAAEADEQRKAKGRQRWHKWKETNGTNVSKRLPTTANDLRAGDARVEVKTSNLDIEPVEKKKTRGDADGFVNALRALLDEDRLDALVKHRRSRKAPVTAYAAKLFIEAANACGISAAEATDHCIERNWLTVKPDWIAAKPPPRGSPPLRMDDFLGAVIDHQERQNAGPDRKIEGPPQALRAIPGGRWTG
jgi:hypothetical protein